MMVENKTIAHRMTNCIIAFLLAVMAASCLLPLLKTKAVSFSSKEAAEAGLVAFWPVGFTLKAYKDIMAEASFFKSFFIAIERVVLSLIVTLPVLSMAAYPLAKTRREFGARSIIMWLFVFCMLFSGGTIPWFMVMKRYGLMNNVFGLAVCGGLPVFNLLLVVSFFRGIPKELEEAAMVDGAGAWYILARIVVPLSKAVLATIYGLGFGGRAPVKIEAKVLCYGHYAREREGMNSMEDSMEKEQTIIFAGDKHCMNWLRGDYEYAYVRTSGALRNMLSCHIQNTRDGDVLHTDISITNTSSKPCLIGSHDISVQLPLVDKYDDSAMVRYAAVGGYSPTTCLTQRCNTHIFCGGGTGWVCALRMGGEPPHLGLAMPPVCGQIVLP